MLMIEGIMDDYGYDRALHRYDAPFKKEAGRIGLNLSKLVWEACHTTP